MTTTDSPTKLAIITGGSRGLGRSTALALAAKGVDVLLTYHSNRAEADSAVAEIEKLGRRAAALRLDVANISSLGVFVDEVKRLLPSTFGRDRFDHLINNAGVGHHATFTETTEADFDRLMNIHLKSVFFLTQKLLPLLADGGRIVNVSSGLARFALPGFSAYGTMKGGVEVLTRYLAKELGPRKITVNTVAPGAIATDFNGGGVRDNPELNKFVASVTALGRAGVSEDIGPMIAAFLGEENRWITGQRIEVSGGMFL